MLELQHLSRPLCTTLAAVAVLLVGCASKEPPAPQITLQDPETTPREKWSDAMKILRDDLGIKGMKDVPVETARQYGLIAGVSEPVRGNSGSMGDLAFGGIGAALFLIPTGQARGAWQEDQVAAWISEKDAKNIEEAIKIAIETVDTARKKAFSKLATYNLKPSALADNSPGQFIGFKNTFFENPVQPSEELKFAPSFIKTNGEKYYGPIFMSGFRIKIVVDALRNDIQRDEAMRLLSAELPDEFVIYNSGRRKAGKDITPFPPSILVAGKEYNFIGK